MTIIDIITQILEILILLVIEPIDRVLVSVGVEYLGLSEVIFSVGFGSIEWFSINLRDLFIILLGSALGFIILRLIYRFIKWLFRLGKGLVGIR